MSSRLVPTPRRTEERVRVVATIGADGTASLVIPRRRPGQPAIVSRLLAAVPAAAGNVLQDGFNRTVVDAWGTPDIGPPWEVLLGVTTSFDVSPALGGQISSGGNNLISSPVALLNPSISCYVRRTGGAGGSDCWANVCGRVSAAGDFYAAVCRSGTPSTFDNVQMTKVIGGVSTILAGPTTVAALNDLQVLFVISGSFLTASFWSPAAGQSQATGVTLEATDLDLTAAGGVGGARIVVDEPVPAGLALYDNFIATAGAAAPIWDAYINDTGQLINIIDSSVIALDRWIPQVVNGQRLNPGESLVIVPRSGQAGSEAIVTCSLVYPDL